MSKSELRNQALAKRVYKLRQGGVSVRETAEACGIHKGNVRKMQLLGERLMQLDQ